MNEALKVKDIMAKALVTLGPDDDLYKVTELFERDNHDGLPVVNEDGMLIGIVTAYDMVSQSFAVHLPILQNILEDIKGDKAGPQNLKDHFEKLKVIKVRDMMNQEPLVLGPEVKVEDLAKEFVDHHRVNPIPIVDENKKLLGIVSRFDVLRFFDKQYLDKVLASSGHKDI